MYREGQGKRQKEICSRDNNGNDNSDKGKRDEDNNGKDNSDKDKGGEDNNGKDNSDKDKGGEDNNGKAITHKHTEEKEIEHENVYALELSKEEQQRKK